MLLTTLRRSPSNRSAFTLMEVLVVVAILVILAGVAIIAIPRYMEEARKARAQTAAVSISQACEAYRLSTANPDDSYPQAPEQLVQPPFGGPSFLKNGMNDLLTPWNTQFTLEPRQKSDMTWYILVWTEAPDGTLISNFGVGEKAIPQF